MEVEAASTTASQIAPALPATTEFPSFTSTTNSKSRKFRRRPVEDDDGPAATAAPTTTTAAAPSQPSQTTTTLTIPPAPPPRSPNAESSEPTPSLTEILRLRKKIARTSALRGLEVSAPKHAPQTLAQDSGANDNAAAKAAVSEAEVEAVVNRFTHQTGQILDVDKHMMAYIEGEMSKRRGEQGGDGSGAGGGNTGARGAGWIGGGSGRTDQESTKSAYWTPVVPEGRGATLGKLHEVDLGEEAKKHNIARTKEATRRLQGGEEEIEDDPSTAPNTSTANNNIPNRKKMKNRRRRNSQDVQRDKLVEEVLKESRRTTPPPPFTRLALS